MAMQAVWTHGNALTIENPENLSSAMRFGWGTDVTMQAGKGSWFHIPLASPVIVGGTRSQLQRVFIMFKNESGSINNIHVYDGVGKFSEFNGLSLRGDHRSRLDGSNTLELPQAHSVSQGIGISFHFQADSRATATLSVSAAGGDFIT